MTPPGTYVVAAHNTATASTNRIHDDRVAREYGFRGGLVPGVDVYAYLTHEPAARWGREWLENGTITARFRRPVYDGERVTVTGAEAGDRVVDLVLTGPGGEADVRATAQAAVGAEAPRSVRSAPPPAAPRPETRPMASADSLRAGTVLGALRTTFDAERADAYLADVREDLPLYRHGRCAHPGWLLRLANSVLIANVELGPWIHVASDVTLAGLVHPGQTVEARAAVVDEHERNGHRFVVLDVALVVDDTVVQRIAHTAIHTPRR